ncbi:hypothetical protein CLH62_14640 [Marinobacter guineae]|uniref:Uncharacterized protein n=1 Tax=Marinobacter guineae TaxID=432303 RepID=A0A2G1VCA7_9GAMM|nr:hypothetical protein [Marinobacter guineae]PHQ24169.1 hypothetical protein CLH62_14640 [Marinobacter guineae]
MNKFSSCLTDCRSRLLDAEATLNFLNSRENLNNLLEHDSPDVVIGAMISQAWNLVASASGDCEAMCDTHDDQVTAEIKKTAAEIVNYQREPTTQESANTQLMNPVDDLGALHSQTRSMLLMMMLYLERAREGGSELSGVALENYVGQLISNVEQAEQATMKLTKR